MAQEVFRFVTLQKFKPGKNSRVENTILISIEHEIKSGLMKKLKISVAECKADKSKVTEVLKTFSKSDQFMKNMTPVITGYKEIKKAFDLEKYDEILTQKRLLGSKLQEIEKFISMLADTIVYYSFGIAPAAKDIMKCFKIFVGLKKIANGEITTDEELKNYIKREVIISNEIDACYKAFASPEQNGTVPIKKDPVPPKKTVKRLFALKSALQKLKDLTDDDIEVKPIKRIGRPSQKRVMKMATRDGLEREVREIYDEAERRAESDDHESILYEIENEATFIESPDASGGIVAATNIGGNIIFTNPRLPGVIGLKPEMIKEYMRNIHGAYVKIYGVANFEVLKQVWFEYKPGEIAHIENVMNGEKKTRKHIKSDEIEIETESFSENVESAQNELETTERFELQNEISKMHNEQKSLDFGVKITADGPWGSIESSLNSESSSEYEVNSDYSTQFAKETVEKALTKIQKTVRENRRTKTISKVIEKNSHQLEGKKEDGSHTVGIYRWVDKVYKTWIENIGKRMVIEFHIPEPAKFYVFSQLNKLSSIPYPIEPMVERINIDNVIDEGEAANAQIEKLPLTPEYVTRRNYLRFAELYKISGIEAPPAEVLKKSIEFKEEFFSLAEESEKKKDTKLGKRNLGVKPINFNVSTPKGYLPSRIIGDMMGTFSKTSIQNGRFEKKTITFEDKDSVFENIGDFFGGESDHAKIKDGTGGIEFSDRTEFNRLIGSINGLSIIEEIYAIHSEENLNMKYERYYFNRFLNSIPNSADENMSLSFQARGMQLISGTIEFQYTLGTVAFTEWQIKTYEKIMTAYYELKADADAKLAQQRLRQGVVINGRNPGINREIMDIEIKKHCIDFMYQDRFVGSDNSYFPLEDGGYPEFNYPASYMQGRVIEFLEQSFEWHRMTYVLYPYFWSRKDTWLDKINYEDPDPLFNKFLSAGASRVVVPVRPGFERALANFLYNYGLMWDSSEPPPIPGWAIPEDAACPEFPNDNDIFLEIISQLKEEVEKNNTECPPDDAQVEYVKIPTSLVWLDSNDKLPVFNESCKPTA